jgi:hypothetical protein
VKFLEPNATERLGEDVRQLGRRRIVADDDVPPIDALSDVVVGRSNVLQYVVEDGVLGESEGGHVVHIEL